MRPPARGLAARPRPPRRPDPDRALRARRRRPRARQRLLASSTTRSTSASASRPRRRCQGRRRRGGRAGRRGLPPRARVRPAADRRARHRHRPPGHAAHRRRLDPRRDPLPDPAPRGGRGEAGRPGQARSRARRRPRCGRRPADPDAHPLDRQAAPSLQRPSGPRLADGIARALVAVADAAVGARLARARRSALARPTAPTCFIVSAVLGLGADHASPCSSPVASAAPGCSRWSCSRPPRSSTWSRGPTRSPRSSTSGCWSRWPRSGPSSAPTATRARSSRRSCSYRSSSSSPDRLRLRLAAHPARVRRSRPELRGHARGDLRRADRPGRSLRLRAQGLQRLLQRRAAGARDRRAADLPLPRLPAARPRRGAGARRSRPGPPRSSAPTAPTRSPTSPCAATRATSSPPTGVP